MSMSSSVGGYDGLAGAGVLLGQSAEAFEVFTGGFGGRLGFDGQSHVSDDEFDQDAAREPPVGQSLV